LPLYNAARELRPLVLKRRKDNAVFGHRKRLHLRLLISQRQTVGTHCLEHSLLVPRCFDVAQHDIIMRPAAAKRREAPPSIPFCHGYYRDTFPFNAFGVNGDSKNVRNQMGFLDNATTLRSVPPQAVGRNDRLGIASGLPRRACVTRTPRNDAAYGLKEDSERSRWHGFLMRKRATPSYSGCFDFAMLRST